MGLVPIICKHYICQLETLRRKSNEVVDILCVWISFYTCANQQKEAPSEALQKRGGELLPHPPLPTPRATARCCDTAPNPPTFRLLVYDPSLKLVFEVPREEQVYIGSCL